jgi:hypothetical protein
MSNPIVGFNNTDNWELTFEESKSTPYTYPIPGWLDEFELGFHFEQHIIAVRAVCQYSKPTWRSAGRIHQRLAVGGSNSQSPLRDLSLESHPLRLNEFTLFDFTKYTSEYILVFQPVHWLRDVTVTVFSYVGPETTDTDQKLDQIITKLNQLN